MAWQTHVTWDSRGGNFESWPLFDQDCLCNLSLLCLKVPGFQVCNITTEWPQITTQEQLVGDSSTLNIISEVT